MRLARLVEGSEILDQVQEHYLKTIQSWLSSFDMQSKQVQVRLELQYEKSKDFLLQLILGKALPPSSTLSIERMRAAYDRIRQHLQNYLDAGLGVLAEYAYYFPARSTSSSLSRKTSAAP